MTGVLDECLHETEDIETGEVFECWDCINVEMTPDVPNSPKMFYSLNSSGINTNIIVNLWSYIEGKRVRFLPNERVAKLPPNLSEIDKIDMTIALMNTEKLMEQLSNLKVEKRENSTTFNLKQITKKIDKDIYSALVYGLYYIQNELNVKQKKKNNYLDYVFYN